MEKVCYASSSPKPALVWTTLAFFAGFAGVSAFGPIVPKLKESMALSSLLMGLLGASPALTGSLLRIPFGGCALSGHSTGKLGPCPFKEGRSQGEGGCGRKRSERGRVYGHAL